MKIDIYSICWNEEKFLPYYLRHYSEFANKIVVYDNYSSDRSREILENHPKVDLRSYDSNNKSDNMAYLEIKNNVWKESRGNADWVIVCDIDEIIYHENIKAYLKKANKKGITIPQTSGYQMVSESFPTTKKQIYDEIRRGAASLEITTEYCTLSKKAVFDPNKIREINYLPGCHQIKPEGEVLYGSTDEELKLLHYKYLSLDYVLERYKELRERKSDYDIENNYDIHYFESDEIVSSRFNDCLAKSKLVI